MRVIRASAPLLKLRDDRAMRCMHRRVRHKRLRQLEAVAH